MIIERLPARPRRRWTVLWGFLLFAATCQTTAANEPDAPAAPTEGEEKMSEKWSRTMPVADPPDAEFGQWKVWVEEGWLLVERRSGDNQIEWKIVLAKVVGDALPEIVVNRVSAGARMVNRTSKGAEPVTTVLPAPTGPIPGSLWLSYRDGRYFIRDGVPYFRCVRQAKSGDDTWPKLDIPPRDAKGFGAGMAGTRASVLSGQVSKSWVTVVAGPQSAMRQVNQRVVATVAADGLLRIAHIDLREERAPLKFSGGEMATVSLGDWYVLDDGELLVAKKLDAWQLPNALNARAQRDAALAARLALEKLGGAPAPELSGEVWLNAERPPAWKHLRGKPVLLVLFDLKQASFVPLVPPLLGFEEKYGKQGLAVIGVHAKAPRDEIEKRLAEERIKFPVLIDDGNTVERYGTGFSACLLTDREGKVLSVYKDSLAPPAEIEKLLETNEE